MDSQMPKQVTDRSQVEVKELGTPGGPPKIEQSFIIDALIEENRQLVDNKLYLVALVKQQQAQFAAAEKVWEAERESLMKGEEEVTDGD